jgi:AcrR family transcriptional regulator
LSRDRIVAAAIALADADGLESVSLRKVAAALNAGPMRLYGYMSTKEELLDLMVDAVYSEIPLVEADPDSRVALQASAHLLRQAAHHHEWFADLLGGRPSLGPHALAYWETCMAALHGKPGFEHIDAVSQAVEAVNAYVFGAVKIEITERRAVRSTGMDEHQWQARSGPYLTRMLATGRFPTLAKFVKDATHRDPDTAFETGLGYVLDGIAARVTIDSAELVRRPTGG